MLKKLKICQNTNQLIAKDSFRKEKQKETE